MTGAAVVLVAGLAGGVLAQGRRGPGGPGGPGGPLPMGPGMRGPMGIGPGRLPLGQLDLTESQQSQVRDIMQRYRPEMQQAGKKERDARDGQRKAIETVPLNEGLVRTTTDTLATADVEMALIQARIYNDVYAMLTADQQKKLKDIQAKRESMMDRREQRMEQRQQQRGKV